MEYDLSLGGEGRDEGSDRGAGGPGAEGRWKKRAEDM